MSERSLKIYKPQDIEGLLNIEKLNAETAEKCKKMLQDTEAKCKAMEKTTYDEVLKKFHEEQLKLFNLCHGKVEKFFQSAHDDLNEILNILIEKIKTDENFVKILTNLLFDEVDKLKIKSNKFTIYANNEVLPLLKSNIRTNFDSSDGLSFDYDVRPDLNSQECMVESNYVLARLSIADFREKVTKILDYKNKVD